MNWCEGDLLCDGEDGGDRSSKDWPGNGVASKKCEVNGSGSQDDCRGSDTPCY